MSLTAALSAMTVTFKLSPWVMAEKTQGTALMRATANPKALQRLPVKYQFLRGPGTLLRPKDYFKQPYSIKWLMMNQGRR